ncbi:dTMP kinase [Pseudonocardia ailaonensis]|uniref:Thymidylate kinase n=1 Tax=Pseudonocardia ailaonensis TaxID=367279 RepID=A0ABN2N6P1_9PSEU
MAIPAFRRLWGVTAITATGEWLSLLALSSLAAQLTTGYAAQSFALGGVVATKLLPAIFLGPLAGALADRFDRRRVMVTCDILRFCLFISIPIVGSLWWLFAATFLIEVCALFWIPAKEASVPNLLRRKDQIETAQQLGLVVTYGIAVLAGAGLFAVVSSIGHLLPKQDTFTTVYIALVIDGCAFLLSAAVVWFRIKEISGRTGPRTAEASPSLLTLLREGFAYVVTTPLIRGLVLGIIGAFAAGGAVIASARLYAVSLGGGDAAYSVLFIGVFVGLALGMATAPRLAHRLPHNRLFGTAIVGAGVALLIVAVSAHLFMAIVAVALVGWFAGIAFLTGLTIIGTQVADDIRGRIVAFVQSLVRVVLLGSMSLVPLVVGLVNTRQINLFQSHFLVDGTRFVLLGGGVIAAAIGTLAYRQMDERRLEPLLRDLLSALRQGEVRRGSGTLVAVEGATPAETADQAGRLAEALRARGHVVVQPEDGERDALRWAAATREAHLSGARAKALAAAAIRADLVERVIRPALDEGAVVVVDRFMASPIAQFGVAADRMDAELERGELERLAVWATGGLRPDVSILLDREGAPADSGGVAGEEHARVQRLLTGLVAAEPHDYVVVEADGEPEAVAGKVLEGLLPQLPPAPEQPVDVPRPATEP